jgi:ABC-type cobalamin/Fe3+-siderophores transport system ATPase subunit
MLFKIENLGVIKKVEVDLDKNLTLLCGQNNTGKSYLAYELYNFLTLKGHRVYIAPAERTAINIFSKELALNKNKLFSGLLNSSRNTNEMLDSLRNQVDRYPKPIKDNLELAEDLVHLSKNRSQFCGLADELEQQILKGKILISPEGEIKYIPNNAPEQSLELALTASLVKSLVNIVFYFRHLAQAGDFIIIDEPELNLHPDNQILIARFLGRLVNKGFKVIASTHSDYIIREINTLIMLTSSNEKSAELMKKYGYSKNQLLKPEQIGALLFKENCKSPEKIEVTETGLEIETIDNVIKALNQSSQEVYLSLFD